MYLLKRRSWSHVLLSHHHSLHLATQREYNKPLHVLINTQSGCYRKCKYNVMLTNKLNVTNLSNFLWIRLQTQPYWKIKKYYRLWKLRDTSARQRIFRIFLSHARVMLINLPITFIAELKIHHLNSLTIYYFTSLKQKPSKFNVEDFATAKNNKNRYIHYSRNWFVKDKSDLNEERWLSLINTNWKLHF